MKVFILYTHEFACQKTGILDNKQENLEKLAGRLCSFVCFKKRKKNSQPREYNSLTFKIFAMIFCFLVM